MALNILYHHRTQGKGVEKVHILGIVNGWRSLGHTVDILSPPGVSLEEDSTENSQPGKNSLWRGITRFMPEVVFQLFEIVYNFWAFPAIRKKLKKKKYQMIFERYTFLCFAGILAARLHHIPFFIEVNYISSTPIIRKRTRVVKWMEKNIEKTIFKYASGIIVVSSYLKDELLNSGVPEEKILVLPNAADPKVFKPQAKAPDLQHQYKLQGKNVVGFVGFFYAWHGIDFFINTYEQVSQKVEDLVYLLVGDGPVFSDMNDLIRQKHLEDRILLPGRVPHEDVKKYISLFDVAVMPHSNIYGSPMKILEYMAMGKVVVAPRLGPIEDIIDDGRDGLMFHEGDLTHFSEKLVMALENLIAREKIRKNARQKVENRFNWQCNSMRILELFEKMNHKVN